MSKVMKSLEGSSKVYKRNTVKVAAMNMIVSDSLLEMNASNGKQC